MKCSMTMRVLPRRVRCHHPRDRFTWVKTTDGRSRWGDPHVPTTQVWRRCLQNVRRLAIWVNPSTSTVGVGRGDLNWEAAHPGHTVSVGAGTTRAARHADPGKAQRASSRPRSRRGEGSGYARDTSSILRQHFPELLLLPAPSRYRHQSPRNGHLFHAIRWPVSTGSEFP